MAQTDHTNLLTGDTTNAHGFYHVDLVGNVTAMMNLRQQVVAW